MEAIYSDYDRSDNFSIGTSKSSSENDLRKSESFKESSNKTTPTIFRLVTVDRNVNFSNTDTSQPFKTSLLSNVDYSNSILNAAYLPENSENSAKNHSFNSNFISCDLNGYQSLKIKTKSIENTLLPLINQISKLVNFQDTKSVNHEYLDKHANALLKVGHAVNSAIERFVAVGETIASENPTIRIELIDACKDAQSAGAIIKSETQLPSHLLSSSRNSNSYNEKIYLIQAVNSLLNAVTKVLLLADVVIINQILNSKNKVALTLSKLEYAIDLDSFLKLFTQYGADLIELAQLSGERQNDLKDDKKRLQLSSARWILEKSTMMILSSTKTYLKHMECECSKENLDLVYYFLRKALDTLHYVVADSNSFFDYVSCSVQENSLFKLFASNASFIKAYRLFEDALELLKNNMLSNPTENQVTRALNTLTETTIDFTTCTHINKPQRDRIAILQDEIRRMTIEFLTSELDNFSKNLNSYTTILAVCQELKKTLQLVTIQLSDQLFRENFDATILTYIQAYSQSNQYDLLIESLDKFKEYSDHVQEVCKFLRHISELDIFETTCEHHCVIFSHLALMIHSSAATTALYPNCKFAAENLVLYCDCWEAQINELSVLVKEVQESLNSGVNSKKSVYLSLPRPGKHGTTARITSIKQTSKLDVNEQAKIAKLGLEIKLIQNEIDAEAEKWNEPQNEIVKIAKQMSEMAYEIHLFTRGQGPLKTTQDLFNRAEKFLQNGIFLYGTIKCFISLLPEDYLKDELNELIEKLPDNFNRLKSRLKINTNGKTATFNKVDWVIQDTRDFMNLVTKIVTNCFLCFTKFNINHEEYQSRSKESSSFSSRLSDSNLAYYYGNTFNNDNYINPLFFTGNNYEDDIISTRLNNNNINNVHLGKFNLLNRSSRPALRSQSLHRNIQF